MVGEWSDVRSTCVMKTINDSGQKVCRFRVHDNAANDFAQRAVPFTAVYDARERFSNLKEEMSALPPAQLNAEDIVLIESRIRRWSTKKDLSEKGWTEWGVKLDLASVSLLHVAVRPAQSKVVTTTAAFRI
ncbi:hypothetical protein JVT61DRAFT_9280 [Boletus reticuloceps]|uniref:Uncharacterized protein n=1 Tax=Boletus reticuloceps TaxID=495285 RepID=A0A8I2YH21_9AGAM|nr:hypothetical protein JVT61DRAFT_9280 [Boletus reticuloceps]